MASLLVQAVGSKVVEAVGEKFKDSLEQQNKAAADKKKNKKKNVDSDSEPTPQQLLEHALADTTKVSESNNERCFVVVV